MIDDAELERRLRRLGGAAGEQCPIFYGIDRFRAHAVVGEIGAAAGISPPPYPHVLAPHVLLPA